MGYLLRLPIQKTQQQAGGVTTPQLFNKLSLNFYCTCQEQCKRRACIIQGQPCFYLEARTKQQLNESEAPEAEQKLAAELKEDEAFAEAQKAEAQ